MMPKLARPPLLSHWGDQCVERRQCGLVLEDYGSVGSQSLPIAGERKQNRGLFSKHFKETDGHRQSIVL